MSGHPSERLVGTTTELAGFFRLWLRRDPVLFLMIPEAAGRRGWSDVDGLGGTTTGGIMTTRSSSRLARALGLALSVAVLFPGRVWAHCDSMDGPVVRAAQRALQTNSVELALVWVLPDGEREIRDAFDRTMRVRSAGGETQALADLWFFETVVRVHRTGEGEPYTGLQPAGSEIAAGILQADHALEERSIEELAAHLSGQASHALRDKFDRVVDLSVYDVADVAAGRRYVRAYTDYMHFVEALQALLTGETASHGSAHDVDGEEPR